MNIKKIINTVDKGISKITEYFLIILFAIITIAMLFINSIYLYIDKPDFTINNIWNYVGILINIVFLIVIVMINQYLKKKFLYNQYINKIIFFIYFIFEIAYLKLVPIIPFSDMKYVTDIALSNFTSQIEYLQANPNNLPITIIFNLIFRFTTYDVFVLKIVNIICNIITIYFAYKIYKNIYRKESKLVIFLGVTSISVFLYVNNVYNDIIFTALTTIIIYLVTKEKQSKTDIIIISILSFMQFIIRPVGIIFIIAICMYFLLKKKNIKNVAIILGICMAFYVIYIPIENMLIPKSDEKKEYPIWSYIQMGINEEEFGFQDSSHSTEWTFEDVKKRITDLGPEKLIKLLCKKHCWLWTEGTYQVERYAFGIGEGEQYFYDTPITKLVYNSDTSQVRKALEYLMKGQYFVLIALSLINCIFRNENKNLKDKEDLLLYVIIGLFCFYTIWEMKSRYIYCLYPIFLIFATGGIEKILAKIQSRLLKQKVKLNKGENLEKIN